MLASGTPVPGNLPWGAEGPSTEQDDCPGGAKVLEPLKALEKGCMPVYGGTWWALG